MIDSSLILLLYLIMKGLINQKGLIFLRQTMILYLSYLLINWRHKIDLHFSMMEVEVFLKNMFPQKIFYITAAHSGISDGFQRSIPTINLIKLHGSVTWKKDNEKIEMSLENKIFEDLVKEAAEVNELILGSKEDVDPIWDDSDLNEAIDFFDIENIEQSIFDNTLKEDILKEHINQIYSIAEDKLKCFKERYDLLPIVSPTKQKFSETVFEQHYYQMLRMLSFELEKERQRFDCIRLLFLQMNISWR